MINSELQWYANLDRLPSPDVYACDYEWSERYNEIYWFRQNKLFPSYCDLYIWKKAYDTELLEDEYTILLSADKDNDSHTCICDGLERIAEVVTHDFALNPKTTNWYYSYTHLLYPYPMDDEGQLIYSTVEFDKDGLEGGKFYLPTIKRDTFHWLYDRVCIPF